ncbi:MAG: metallophosphoesterase [Actinomycetota bacterium]|nr:metallophosphoesterase [Actinomycetota bacterium]
MPGEVWTVADDEAVIFDGTTVAVRHGLAPDTDYRDGDVTWRTLPRPGGELLATVTAVNDLHFGETECGLLIDMNLGPVLSSAPGAPPYPTMMNTAAVAEMELLDPAAVIVKGDVTTVGLAAEYDAFEACYRPTFGDRLHITRGNHDNRATFAAFTAPLHEAVVVPGAVLALVDTSRPGEGGGSLDAGQLAWLDDVAASADRPVLVFGHHPCFEAGADDWMGAASHLATEDSEALIALVARRPAIVGYFSGHTHRNRVRRFAATGDVPFAEVGSVKDFPGSWAEYRIFEGGILAVHRRLSDPAALEWSESCRALFAGLYPRYAGGDPGDRSYPVWPRSPRAREAT